MINGNCTIYRGVHLNDIIKSPNLMNQVLCMIINYSGSFTDEDTRTLIRECVLMYRLAHPNIISLIGLCLDAGPFPYIILPFMENGSLLSYVKDNREILVTNTNTDDEMVG